MSMPYVPAQIRTYGQLKDAVSLWADRDDEEFVGQVPNFINFAEKEIHRNLRTPITEREEYLRIVNGVAFIPSDLLEIRYIMNADTGQMCRVTSPEELDWLRRNKTNHRDQFSDQEIVFSRMAGRFYFYPLITSVVPNSNIDANGGVLPGSQPADGNPDPDASAKSAYLISYYADPQELVEDTDTNTLLTVAPEALLYAALKHAALFVQDDNAVQKWAALADAAITELNNQNTKFEYSGSPLVIPNNFWGNQTSGHQSISYNYVRL